MNELVKHCGTDLGAFYPSSVSYYNYKPIIRPYTSSHNYFLQLTKI